MLNDEWRDQVNLYFRQNPLGLMRYDGNTFWAGLTFYFCEIWTLFHVMLHILKETLAGVFDVPYDRFETFEEGLLRYRLLVLCQTEEERAKALASLATSEKYKISPEDVDPYRQEVYIAEHERYGYFSEFDKYEISEVILADPIRDKSKLIASEGDGDDSGEDLPVFEEFADAADQEEDEEGAS